MLINQHVYVYPSIPANPGTAKLVALFTCNRFSPGDEGICHQAEGVMEVKMMGFREVERILPGGGDYTYVEVPVPIARVWEAKVVLQLPWGCCDDWAITEVFHNSLGLSEKDAHDLVQTTGICNHLAALISNEENDHA